MGWGSRTTSRSGARAEAGHCTAYGKEVGFSRESPGSNAQQVDKVLELDLPRDASSPASDPSTAHHTSLPLTTLRGQLQSAQKPPSRGWTRGLWQESSSLQAGPPPPAGTCWSRTFHFSSSLHPARRSARSPGLRRQPTPVSVHVGP